MEISDSGKSSKNSKTAIFGTSKYEKSAQQKFKNQFGKKSGQLLSRDRSTQKQISQLTTKTKPVSP